MRGPHHHLVKRPLSVHPRLVPRESTNSLTNWHRSAPGSARISVCSRLPSRRNARREQNPGNGPATDPPHDLVHPFCNRTAHQRFNSGVKVPFGWHDNQPSRWPDDMIERQRNNPRGHWALLDLADSTAKTIINA